MSDFVYKISLPKPLSENIARRELHVMIDGEMEINEIGTTVSTWNLSLFEGSEVVVFLVDIDDCENRSTEGDPLVFYATNKVPPKPPKAPEIFCVINKNDPSV